MPQANRFAGYDNQAENPQSQTTQPNLVMQDWRAAVLDRLLPIAVMAVFPAMVGTVILAINNKNTPWLGVVLLVVLYIFLIFVTLRRSLGSMVRSWAVVLLAYAAGIVTMMRGGLAGSGRIYFLMMAVMAVTLISGRIGVNFGVLGMVTYIVFGIAATAGFLKPSLIVLDNPLDAWYWFYEGLTMATLVVVTVYLNIKFAEFQLDTLKSMEKMAKALKSANRQLETINQQLENKVEQRTQELVEANRHLEFLASHDLLTGLPNRMLLYDRLAHAIRFSHRENTQLALLFIDLDNFKAVNDTLGHEEGDNTLKAVASVLRNNVRESDTVARLAGDEFAIILNGIQSKEHLEKIVSKLLSVLTQPLTPSQASVPISASIGISIYPRHGLDAETLLRRADAAMYVVKGGTKNDYLIFGEGDLEFN
jgi:diguanylate cyclase (GGDEF)-like protein